MLHNHSYTNLSLSLVLCTSICSTTLSAKADDLLTSISSEMEHFSEVATITKQNEHYQPYIISVFQGKELEKLGISNLKEALSLVPGLDMATDNVNTQTPIFRGSNPLAYGQSKLLIDGTPVNNVFFDAYSEHLSFPVEMIKRIEVVRGPGSKTDGINAYAGSINVITYAEDFKGFETNDKIVFKGGSYDYRMGGFLKTYKEGDFTLFTDFFYQEDNKKLPSGPDGLSQGVLSLPGLDNTGLSQSGDAPLWLKEYALGVTLTYKDFSLKGRALDHTQGSAYGINLALPRDDDRVKLPSYYLELGYDKEVGDLNVEIKAGVKYDEFDSKAKLLPDGLVYIDAIKYSADPPVIAVTAFPGGIYGVHSAKQRSLYQSAYVTYSGIQQHTFTTGYRIIRDETIDMVSKLSNWETGDAEPVDYTDIYPFFDKDAKRDTVVFSFQDEYYYSDALSFMYGFNYENSSLRDAGFDPRVSVVYQRDTNNIFKAIYSRSHRNASWQEMYTKNNHARRGSTSLEPERVDAFEAAYVRKLSSDNYLQANLFYLMNKDQIYNSSTDPYYRNVMDTDIYGLELEYKGNLTLSDELYLNYSYVTGDSYIKDEDKRSTLSNVAHHLAKGYYIYRIDNAFSLSTVAKYVGSKKRAEDDSRGKLRAYSTMDASLRYKNTRSGYSLTLSVKNIIDAVVKYPSPPRTYSEDYAQERRNFLIAFTKEF